MDQDSVEDFAWLQVQDDEWDELYQKIMEERTQKNLTITDFLVSCGLNPDMPYFQQLCCRTPRRLHPSKRRNSPGREFRDAVAKYFAENVAATPSYQSLETVISDWCLDNRPHLQQSRISGIYLARPNSTDLAVHAYEGCALSDSDILDLLMADSNVSRALVGSVLRIAFRDKAQLLVVTSPVRFNAGESPGTAT